jgi:hypothetical protein
MPFLQDIIHKLEEGGGLRYVRVGLSVLAVVMMTVAYNWRAFRNMSTLEAMDAAQVGRNIAQGKGFTTLFLRPFSMYLVKSRNLEKADSGGQASTDLAEVKGMHPDLANPPVYPTVLAGLMKVIPFDYTASTTKPFWSLNGVFARYQPDFVITIFNQLLFIGIIVLVFLLAARLFDRGVAWVTAILLFGTELFWRFSVSGLSTMLVVLLFMALVWALVLFDAQTAAPTPRPAKLFALAAVAGALVGLIGLTRYAAASLILPVLLFFIVFSGPQRVAISLIAVFAFVAVMAPWVVRNYQVSGTPFGTAGFAIMENTSVFPANRLERSLEPDFHRLFLAAYWAKFITSIRQIMSNDLPKLGGSWVSALFFVGLFLPFNSPTIRRLRYFLVASLIVLVVAQALGRTHLSEVSPDINSENLLVLLAPLIFMMGVSLFFVLLDQLQLPFPELRPAVIGIFVAVASLPLVFVFTPPKTPPVVWPPYYPPLIQKLAGWLKERELVMSDIPWGVAWYGQRQAVWLTLRATPDTKDPSSHEDFFAISDFQKPINALYLTPETMDSRFLSEWIKAGEKSWGSFILESMIKNEVPPTFPLRKSQHGWLPEQLVLTDWERWRSAGGSP